jgi:hypothetical protein
MIPEAQPISYSGGILCVACPYCDRVHAHKVKSVGEQYRSSHCRGGGKPYKIGVPAEPSRVVRVPEGAA